MSHHDLFSEAFIPEILSAKTEKIIRPVKVGETTQQNELVFFIKPELLDVSDDSKISNSLQLIEQKFNAFNVVIRGAAIVPGEVLEEHKIMNRHYGFINQLSRKASKIVDTETQSRIFQSLEIDAEQREAYKILGGHEFLETFDVETQTLSEVWFAQEANKLRSGFYYIADEFAGKKIVLVNGFHPSQLEHFTRKEHRIVLMLLHSDTDWNVLKFDLVGETFPERANPSSIRGMLYANPAKYGLTEVGINTNGIHLSAGPFEAAFEVVNFFGNLIDLDPSQTPPLAIKRAIEEGIPKEQALGLINNPPVNDSDLFSKTENMNTRAAVVYARDKLSFS